jgi:thiol:disulfide interchange protein
MRLRLGSTLCVIAALVASSTGCRKSLVVAEQVAWESDFETAEERASAQHKLLFVFVGASWDSAAKELEHTTFADPEIRELLARSFVSLQVDVTDDEDAYARRAATRFHVVGEPALIIMTADRRTELARYSEYVPPRALARMLAAATREDAVGAARREMNAYRRAEAERWADAQRRAAQSGPAPAATVVLTPLP